MMVNMFTQSLTALMFKELNTKLSVKEVKDNTNWVKAIGLFQLIYRPIEKTNQTNYKLNLEWAKTIFLLNFLNLLLWQIFQWERYKIQNKLCECFCMYCQIAYGYIKILASLMKPSWRYFHHSVRVSWIFSDPNQQYINTLM